MALPLLKTKENENDLAPGFNTKYGQYIGHDFIGFAKGIGLNSKLTVKIISEAVKDKVIVMDTIDKSFMTKEHKRDVIQCFNQRLSLLQVQGYSPI